MSKEIYDSNEKYTEDAMDLDQKANEVIKELFNEFIVKGYKVREISHIIHGAVSEQELERLI